MTEMILKCGTVVLLDEEDYQAIGHFTWRLHQHGYAVRTSNGRMTRMHRAIMGAVKGQIIDHIDRNRLNNCRNNLRFAPVGGNQRNSGKRSGITSSKMKGVTWIRKTNKWQVQINAGVNRYYIGQFETEDEAGHAYNKAAIQYHGEYACLNPIGEDK